jgi:hypothetical protein
VRLLLCLIVIGMTAGCGGTRVDTKLVVTSGVLSRPKMYWTDFPRGEIKAAGLDGSSIETIVAGRPSALGITLSAVGVYWTEKSFGGVQEANLDGSAVRTLVTGTEFYDIALDVAHGKMYLVKLGQVLRANLDGSAVETVVPPGPNRPVSLALDVANGKMYLGAHRSLPAPGGVGVLGEGLILRANLDGSGLETLVTGQVSVDAIALDMAGAKMYWSVPGNGKIRRANLDGSGVEDLVTDVMMCPYGVALHLGLGKLYWVDMCGQKIKRANFDGSGIEDLVTSTMTDMTSPWRIALYHRPVGFMVHNMVVKTALCRNVTRLQEVPIVVPGPPQPGPQVVDCAAAGLVIKSRDQVEVTISGSVP